MISGISGGLGVGSGSGSLNLASAFALHGRTDCGEKGGVYGRLYLSR